MKTLVFRLIDDNDSATKNSHKLHVACDRPPQKEILPSLFLGFHANVLAFVCFETYRDLVNLLQLGLSQPLASYSTLFSTTHLNLQEAEFRALRNCTTFAFVPSPFLLPPPHLPHCHTGSKTKTKITPYYTTLFTSS